MKRFTETGKWADPWFRSLSPTAKLLWQWLLDHCDNAGVIHPDFELASFQIGCAVTTEHVSEIQSRLQAMPNGKTWIPKFTGFQFGPLSEASRVHLSVIKLLKTHGLKENA